MILKSRMRHLQFSPVGNTAMHPVGDADLGVPEVPDFLDEIVAAGGHLWACRMSADMMKLPESDLRDDVDGISARRTSSR